MTLIKQGIHLVYEHKGLEDQFSDFHFSYIMKTQKNDRVLPGKIAFLKGFDIQWMM